MKGVKNQSMTGPRLGILTSGGDCPGLNAVLRTREYAGQLVGFRGGWRGVRESDAIPVDDALTRGIGGLGGTVLGTSRTNPIESGGGELGRVDQEVGAGLGQ